MEKTKTFEFNPSVLILREENRWVAQCLEYDIAAQADSITAVKRAFERAFVSQVAVNVCHGKKPMQDIPKAPKFYWDWFAKGELLSDRPLYKRHLGKGLEMVAHTKEMRIAA